MIPNNILRFTNPFSSEVVDAFFEQLLKRRKISGSFLFYYFLRLDILFAQVVHTIAKNRLILKDRNAPRSCPVGCFMLVTQHARVMFMSAQPRCSLQPPPSLAPSRVAAVSYFNRDYLTSQPYRTVEHCWQRVMSYTVQVMCWVDSHGWSLRNISCGPLPSPVPYTP